MWELKYEKTYTLKQSDKADKALHNWRMRENIQKFCENDKISIPYRDVPWPLTLFVAVTVTHHQIAECSGTSLVNCDGTTTTF